MSKLLFDPGRVLMTPGAMEALAKAKMKPSTLVLRHCALEQGELDNEDQRSNAKSLKNGTRILSSYKIPTGDTLWVISERVDVENGATPRKRDLTTILRPDEY